MSIFINYVAWHYSVAPGGIFSILHNYLVATWHRFLIARHFKTLFYPWHRTQPSDLSRPRTFGDKIMDAIIDFYIRILAALVRLSIIVAGLISELVLIIVFIVLVIVWLIWPILAIAMVVKGILLL